MFRRSVLLSALVLMAVPAMVKAQATGPRPGPWEFTLVGQGTNSRHFDGFTAGATGGLGYFFGDNLEGVLRQTVNYSDVSSSHTLAASTDVGADWNFNIGALQPYAGANIGYIYGDAVKNTWEAGPEGGLKVFVNNSTFIFASVEYEFLFQSGSKVSNSIRDGQFVYGLGIGFRF